MEQAMSHVSPVSESGVRRGRGVRRAGHPLAPLTLGGLVFAGLALAPGWPGAGGPTGPPGSAADPSVPTRSWVDDWDLPGMKVVYVKNLGERLIEITSYRLYDCHNVGLFECETDTPSGRTVRPGEQIELVVVSPILSTAPGGPPPVSFRYTYSARLR